MAPPPPPPPRASAPSPVPSSPLDSPSSRASSPFNPLSQSLGPGATRSRKGETLSLGALMSDLSALTSSAGEACLSGEGRFEPAPPAEDAYAPKKESTEGVTLEQLRSGDVEVAALNREQAKALAESWVKQTGEVLERAKKELDGGSDTVGRASVLGARAGEVRRGLVEA